MCDVRQVVDVFYRPHGVTVSTRDSESRDPSSNLGGTFKFLVFVLPNYLLHSTTLSQ